MKPKGKPKTLSLISSYHPHLGYTDEETNDYNQSIADLFNKFPKNNIIIMGADLNASIGTRMNAEEEEDDDNNNISPLETLIGPCGNPRTNKKGDQYKNLMLQLDLRAVSAFFCNEKGYDTWRNPATDEKFQLDHFLVPRYHSKLIKDVRRKHYGVPSDHWALLLKLDINKGKKQNDEKKKDAKKISK